MPDVYCPPVTDERGRSSDDPCKVWCGGSDFDAWKHKSQQRIAQALMRQDLPASTAAQLREWNQQIELLPRSKVDSGEAVRMMAAIARQAECIALASSPATVPATLQVRPPDMGWQRKLMLAAIVGGALYLLVQTGLLRKIMRRRK